MLISSIKNYSNSQRTFQANPAKFIEVSCDFSKGRPNFVVTEGTKPSLEKIIEGLENLYTEIFKIRKNAKSGKNIDPHAFFPDKENGKVV